MPKNGWFSIKGASTPFENAGVDMALEQPINAEAINRLKGIMAYTDISTAVNRWITTDSMRSDLIIFKCYFRFYIIGYFKY